MWTCGGIFGAKSKRKDFAPTSGKLWSSAAAKAFISSRYLKVSQNRLPREIFHLKKKDLIIVS